MQTLKEEHMTGESHNSSKLLHLAVCAIIPAIILLMPETQFLTKDIKIYIAITLFIIALVSLELFDILIPSILLPSLYCISGIVDAGTAFVSWTNTIIYMIIGAFTLTNVLERCGLLNRIALFCIKKCGGTFWHAVRIVDYGHNPCRSDIQQRIYHHGNARIRNLQSNEP